MSASRLLPVLALVLSVASCGGSSSETPPPIEPSAADLAAWRAPPIPSGTLPSEEETEPRTSDPGSEDPRPAAPGPHRRGRGRRQ